MMRRIYFLLFLLLLAQQLSAQNPPKADAWNILLNNVKIKYIYSLQYEALVPKAKFADGVRALDGKVITLSGFFLPFDITGNVFVISYNPMSMCFFCNGSGIQTIVELKPQPEHVWRLKRLKTDDFFEVKGKLKLNENDYDHLIYILEDVEFVKLIR